MLKIGLTGGIGTGKSTVASIFSVFRIPILNADSLSKQLIHSLPALQDDIRLRFGAESFLPDGSYNTKYISSIVFQDSMALQDLNRIVHPYVESFSEQWWQEAENEGSIYALKEAAILFEAGMEKHLDYVIGVDAPLELRFQRITQRDNISSEEIMKRIERQMDNSEKMTQCDFVIQNDDSQSLIEQVLNIHDKLLQIHEL